MHPEDRETAAEILKALAHPVRLGVIELLAEREWSVSELYRELGCSQSVMSTQCGILKKQGLIKMRREGNVKFCSLRNRDFLQLVNCLENHLRIVLNIDPPKGE